MPSGGALRRLTLDYQEFDPPESEQTLELAIASLREHRSLSEFTALFATSDARETPPMVWKQWGWICDNIAKFLGVSAPPITECRTEVIGETWDDVELVIESATERIWYHWWTTA